jgi:Histidinol phosphatase and related hydrolases of the PHP family
MNKIELDVHTHTIASGHAYSTLMEMVAEGQRKGLSVLGITEHGEASPPGPAIRSISETCM